MKRRRKKNVKANSFCLDSRERSGNFLLLATLSLYFVARRETGRAEANLRLAKKAVDESLSSAGRQQAREAPDPPQLERLRHELLIKAEEFYSNFLTKQGGNDPEFRAESALVHSKLGDINRLLEKNDDAVTQYRYAISGLENLLQEAPANPEYRQALAYAHNWLGETLRLWSEETHNQPDNRKEALDEYDGALRLQQALHEAQPQNEKYQQELARTYYNRGILHLTRAGDSKVPPKAIAVFQVLIHLSANRLHHEVRHFQSRIPHFFRDEVTFCRDGLLAVPHVQIMKSLFDQRVGSFSHLYLPHLAITVRSGSGIKKLAEQ